MLHHGVVPGKHRHSHLNDCVFRFDRQAAQSIAQGFGRRVEQAIQTQLTYRAIVRQAA